MARNHRKVEGEVTYSWIAVRLLLFILIVGIMLGILFIKNRNLKLGDELRVLERELRVTLEKSSSLEAQLARYKTPRELEDKLAQWNLEMVRPLESQIRRFREPEAHTDDDVIRPRILVQADSMSSTSPHSD